ncbi:MAG: hypothetical protein MUO75_03040 [Actinobacteria bacterium]|nr:hypothetical protein [Actinomycetota bacterium]
MAFSQTEDVGAEGQKPRRDVYDMVLRAVSGLLINFVVGKLKKRQGLKKERKKAARQVSKLAKKKEEIPEELREEATRGLSRRQKRKARKAGKARKKRRLWIIVALAIAVALVVKSTRK